MSGQFLHPSGQIQRILRCRILFPKRPKWYKIAGLWESIMEDTLSEAQASDMLGSHRTFQNIPFLLNENH